MHSPLVRRIVHTFSTQVGCQIIGILTGIVVARQIGPAGKGFTSYAITAVNLVSVFFFGFSDAVLYQLGRQQHPARAVHAAMMRVIFVSLVILVPVFVTIAIAVPSQRPLAAAATVLPFALYLQLATPFLLVADNILLTNIRAVTQSLGTAVLTIPLLLLAHLGLGAVIGVWILFYIVAAAQSAWGVRAILASSPPIDEAPKELAGEQVHFGLRAAGTSVAGFCNVRVNMIIVSVMLSTTALGWYALAIASGEMLWQVSRALLWPALSRIGSDPQAQSAQLVARLTRNTLALVGGLGIVAEAIGPWLITHVYGQAFAPAGAALRWALPGLVTYAVEAALTQFIMLRLVRPITLISIQGMATVLCATITIATVQHFGIVAAAASTSLTYLLVSFALVGVFMRATGIPLSRIVIVQREDLGHYASLINGVLKTLRLRSA